MSLRSRERRRKATEQQASEDPMANAQELLKLKTVKIERPTQKSKDPLAVRPLRLRSLSVVHAPTCKLPLDPLKTQHTFECFNQKRTASERTVSTP